MGALALQQVFAGIAPGFANPVAMLQAPSDVTRWFVVEQGGRVRVFGNNPGATSAPDFLNIASRVSAGGEMGLLGMAFHPDFPIDPRVFLSYTNQSARRVSRISEFRSNNGGATLDPNSERILLVVGQPEDNHNGGNIAFGPDGYLYIGLGDGGSGNDPHGPIGNGQLMTTLLGKMLRIDVNGAQPYGIPPDNPFAGFRRCGVP
jgi:glucose/arabinose dehydrogenase